MTFIDFLEKHNEGLALLVVFALLGWWSRYD